MSSFLKAILFMSALSACHPVFAQETQKPMDQKQVQEAFDLVAKKLSSVMATCSERIWPNYDYKDIDVVLLSEFTEPQLWTVTNGLKKMDESLVPKEAFNFIYSKLTLNGRKAVGIYVDKDSNWILREDTLFNVIVHEGFHFYGQPTWKQRGGQRGTRYPLASAPRYDRRMVYEEIFNYAQDPQKNRERLGKAAHHHNKWMSENPEEVKSTTDGYEGTARYVDQLAEILYLRGCEAPDSELYAIYNSRIASELGGYMTSGSLELDGEGYAYGAITSFLLRFENLVPNWTTLVAEGKTPAEILFENIAPVVGEENQNLKSEYESATIEENGKIKVLLDPTLQVFNSKDMVRVVAPTGSVQGYGPIGFFLPVELPGITLIPMGAELTLYGSDWTVQVAPKTVMISGFQSPCATTSFSFLVPANAVGAEATKIDFNSESLKGSMNGEFKTDAEGYRWFCGK